MDNQFICKNCEKQCVLDIDEYEGSIEVTGNQCSDGINYAMKEKDNTKGILTTLVRIKGGRISVLPVKSSMPIERKIWLECSKALSRIYVGIPVKIGDVICKNILNTGVDIVSTKNVNS